MMTAYEIVIVQQGDDRYEPVIGVLRADRNLLDLMWTAAESRLDEHPDKVWIVAVDPPDRALAWCAYESTAQPGRVKCVNSFERPESWDNDLYALVYEVRQELLHLLDLTADTFIFDDPMDLHAGWTPFADGWSAEPDAPPHHWTGLTWSRRTS